MFTRNGKEIQEGFIHNGKKAGYMEDRYCPKCGGAGRGPWFPDGGICYRCGGSGGHHKAFVKLYTQEQLDKLNEAAEKRRLVKIAQIEAEKAVNQETVLAQYGDLIQRARPFVERNSFISDIVYKLENGIFPTDKQVIALEKVISMLSQQDEKKAEKGEAPLGKQMVVGTICTVKRQYSQFGIQEKMLVELENHSTVWGSVGKALWEMVPCSGEARRLFDEGDLDASFKARFRGVKVQFEADFSHADNDSTHSFFKRPVKFSLV